jgi:hypothetical protein
MRVASQLNIYHAGKVYCRRFVSTRLAATLLADGAPCFAVLFSLVQETEPEPLCTE